MGLCVIVYGDDRGSVYVNVQVARRLIGQRSHSAHQIEATAFTQLPNHITHVSQQQPRKRVRLRDVLHRSPFSQSRRHFELQTERRQMVTEGIVQVSRDPQAFGHTLVLDHERPCCLQFPVDARERLARTAFAFDQRRTAESEELKSTKGRAIGDCRKQVAEGAEHGDERQCLRHDPRSRTHRVEDRQQLTGDHHEKRRSDDAVVTAADHDECTDGLEQEQSDRQDPLLANHRRPADARERQQERE